MMRGLALCVLAALSAAAPPGNLGTALPPPDPPLAPVEESSVRTQTSVVVHWGVPTYVCCWLLSLLLLLLLLPLGRPAASRLLTKAVTHTLFTLLQELG
jgi:hypothetical protein